VTAPLVGDLGNYFAQPSEDARGRLTGFGALLEMSRGK
jgi:hypothetical protein